MKSNERSVAFAEGFCAALSVIAAHDAEVIWREAVKSNGGYDYLRGISKRAGNLSFDGFTRYKRERAS